MVGKEDQVWVGGEGERGGGRGCPFFDVDQSKRSALALIELEVEDSGACVQQHGTITVLTLRGWKYCCSLVWGRGSFRTDRL